MFVVYVFVLNIFVVLIVIVLVVLFGYVVEVDVDFVVIVVIVNVVVFMLDVVVVIGLCISMCMVKNSFILIDVIFVEDFVVIGQGNLLEVLQCSLLLLSQIGGYQSDQESLICGYQLCNLLLGYMLVLVNGKCCNVSVYVSGVNGGGFLGYVWVDLVLILVLVIDYVEVLCDGVLVIYGLDVIIGVVNVILKLQVYGGEFVVESGQSIDGDGLCISVCVNVGLLWGVDGFVNLFGEIMWQYYVICICCYIDGYLSYLVVDVNGNLVVLCLNNWLLVGVLLNLVEVSCDVEVNIIFSLLLYVLKVFVVNVGYGLGDSVQFYVNVIVSDCIVQVIQNFCLLVIIFIIYKVLGVLSVFFDGFLLVLEIKEKQYIGIIGVKGQIVGWDYDVSLIGNCSMVCMYICNLVNYLLLYFGLFIDFYDGKLDYQQGIVNLDL